MTLTPDFVQRLPDSYLYTREQALRKIQDRDKTAEQAEDLRLIKAEIRRRFAESQMTLPPSA